MTTANDAAAYKLIYDTRAERLVLASARAEKWIAGLTALITVLTTAMVVKGPENFAKAEGAVRAVVLVLVLLGGIGLAAGILCAYTAAFGGLFSKSAVDTLLDDPPTLADGASSKLETAVTTDAKSARAYMRGALLSTCLGMVALTMAITAAWFSTPKEESAKTTCAKVGEETVVFSGELKVTSGTIAIVECPE
jgi:amino acid transporter